MWKKPLSLVVLLSSLLSGSCLLAAEPPPDRVVVMYFHRTLRCPTCLRMETYARQALQEAFAQQLQNGQVAFYSIDFQDERNARFTKVYRIVEPSLIVVKVVNNKGVEFKNLEEIWFKIRRQEEFLRYVQTEVAEYLPRTAQKTASR